MNRYYAVNDRPVGIVRTPDGGADALVVDFVTGALVPDRSYFARVSDVGIGKDVDSLTAGQFEAAVARLRAAAAERLPATPLSWQPAGDGTFRSVVRGREVTCRVAADGRVTLLADGHEGVTLAAWPAVWVTETG